MNLDPKPETVAERNAWFLTLEPWQQRVQTARDVVQYLQAGQLLAKSAVYASIPLTFTSRQDLRDQGLQRLLEKSTEACTVCAKGALLLARVRGYDHFELHGGAYIEDTLLLGEEDVLRGLDGIFEEDQLMLIECAFEQDAGFWCSNWDEDATVSAKEEACAEQAAELYTGLTPQERLCSIMQNIIEHNGDFVVAP